jgi:hypothetical protein
VKKEITRDNNVVIPLRGPTLDASDTAHNVEAFTKSMSVEDQVEYETSAGLLKEIVSQTKALKSEMDGMIRPINDGIKKIRSMYKPALDSLDNAARAIKGAMLTYRQGEQLKQAKADDETRRLLAEGDHERAMVNAQVDVLNVTPITGTQIRRVWKFRVVNAEIVPFIFMTPDLVALRKYAVARGWQNPPPGIEFYQEETLAVTT